MNGIIANDNRFFCSCLQIFETIGPIPAPAFPARFDIKITVEYFPMLFLISSDTSNVEPLIRWVDGLTTDFVEIFIEFSEVRSFLS